MSQEDSELDVIYDSKEDISTTACVDDSILVKMFNASSKATHEKMSNGPSTGNDSNSNDSSSKTKRKWKVGERCMAPYAEDRKYYNARILAIHKNDSCEVEYIGYEDSNAMVEIRLLLSESENEESRKNVEAEPMEQVDTTTNTTTTSAPATSSGTDTFPIPELCPPPPPSLLAKVAQAANDKEALSNMLMSWYMAGYHSGFYQGLQKAGKEHNRAQ